FFSTNYIQDSINFSSLREDLKNYRWGTLKEDLTSAFIVALLTVPQAMAFSLAAGLPLACGLFTSIYGALVASLFGSCRQMIVGANNTIAILLQLAIAGVLHNHFRDVTGPERETLALHILMQLVLLIGVIQALAAFFKLGRLTQFVSYSVIVAFMTGTAIALLIGQSFVFLGIPAPGRSMNIFSQALFLFSHLGKVHIPTAAIGLLSLVSLVLLKKFYPKLPGTVLVLILAGVVVHLLGLSTLSEWNLLNAADVANNVILVGDTGAMQDIFPTLSFPLLDLEMVNDLIPYAFALALLSSVETAMVAKQVTSSTGQTLSVDQDIFGLAMANILCSFMGAMPPSGSISRTLMILKMGGKTHFSGALSALCVGLVVAAFGYFVQRIPLTALSAVLLVTGVQIIQFKQLLLCLKSTRADAAVLIITVVSCLFFGLDNAFYVGVVISVTLYLKKAAVPYFVECIYDDSGHIDRTHTAKGDGPGQIRVINVQGELFFGAADLFQNTLKSITCNDEDLKVVILRLKNARDIDATACLALQQLANYLRDSGRHLILCGLTYPTWEVLSHSGTIDIVGKENLFITDQKLPKLSLQKALKRARELIKESTPEKIEEPPALPAEPHHESTPLLLSE
ncbi:MAG: SulP family inorganic anion transporter, partial [Chlamydiia bacterium]|nr:SulP family inorganic anion transporter [Chlamydiia bacterium]